MDTPRKPLQPGSYWLLGLIAVCVVIELVLRLSDLGLVGPERLRALAYEYAGFWPGLLDDWRPNYTAQPYLMFATYGFLHGGLVHLIVNMITLWSLGTLVIGRVRLRGFALLYIGALIGGAIGYSLLSVDPRPMVGASGALFGLIGGVLAWLYVDRYTYSEGLLPVLQAVVMLIILNLVLWWAMDGQLAWETHLGGFITGWIVALLIDPRAVEPDPAPTAASPSPEQTAPSKDTA
jgi:membrane associated rhomboid family serine protease